MQALYSCIPGPASNKHLHHHHHFARLARPSMTSEKSNVPQDRLAGDRPALVSWIVIPSCPSWVLGVDHRRTIGPIIWLSGFHALCLTGLKLTFPLDRGPVRGLCTTDFESRRRSWLQGEDHPNSFSCWNGWIIHLQNWEQKYVLLRTLKNNIRTFLRSKK